MSLLGIKSAITVKHKPSCGYVFSFLLHEHLWMELLETSGKVGMLDFVRNLPFPKMAVPCWAPVCSCSAVILILVFLGAWNSVPRPLELPVSTSFMLSLGGYCVLSVCCSAVQSECAGCLVTASQPSAVWYIPVSPPSSPPASELGIWLCLLWEACGFNDIDSIPIKSSC